ncbi:MAG: hypothetical protein U9O98_07135 [Asgard group archaeon]|nr:hypothetical protein [Asgard group archaeon]
MAYTIPFWFALIQGFIVSAASLIFMIVMILNFYKKKTMGTALLAFMYGSMFFTQLGNTLFILFSAINPYTLIQKISLVGYLSSLALVYIFLYFFASRHILKDSDIMKVITSIFVVGVSFAIIAIVGYELIAEVPNPVFTYTHEQAATGLSQVLPNVLASIIVYVPLLVLVQFRLLISMTRTYLSKKQKDPIRRRGFLYILLSVCSLFITMLLTVLFTIEGISKVGITVLYVARAIFVLLTLYFSYVGWILPNWFKRRIRKKAWISDKLSTDSKPTSRHVTSKTMIHEKKIIKEIVNES